MASNSNTFPEGIDGIETINPTKPHTHTIILLHGRGSKAFIFKDEFFESESSDKRFLQVIFPTIKWVLPCAPVTHATLDQEDVSQWFDMWSVKRPDEKEELQTEGLRRSIEAILTIVRQEAALVSPDRIILGGISQGAATAIMSLLFGGMKLGGFIGFIGWLPFEEEMRSDSSLRGVRGLLGFGDSGDLPAQSIAAALETPVLLEHCRDDRIVPVGNGEILYETLVGQGMNVTWRVYEKGGHWVNEPEGIDDMVTFIKTCFKMA